MERHLAGCTRCALEVAQLQALRRLLASPEVPEAPSGLRERLLGIGRDTGAETGARIDPDAAAGATHARAADRPPSRVGEGLSPAVRPVVGAMGLVAAGLVVLGAAGVGALVTGVTTPTPGMSTRASLTTVLPALLSWPDDPGAAATVRPVDNDDRP